MNAQLRQIGGDRCVIPVKNHDGMVQYFVFKGHQNSYLHQKRVKAEVRVSERDSQECAEQHPDTSKDPYQVIDVELLPGLKNFSRLLNLNNKHFSTSLSLFQP